MPRVKTPPPSPETLAAMHLKCVVCAQEIPGGRVRRRKDTCSAECYDLLRHYKASLFKQWRCPTCLSPNTPKDREEFKLWRQETRGRREKRGKAPKRESKLAAALAVTMAALENAIEWAKQGDMPGSDSDEVKEYEELIERARLALIVGELPPKPVDTAPAERDSISADTQTPTQP